MQKQRIGVLRGGKGKEYHASLASGKSVLKALPREQFEPIDIFVDREGVWHVGGYPLSPDKALKYIDVAWNTLLGQNAAGDIQRTLESLGIPYTGTKAMPSAIASHRVHARKRLADSGIAVPAHTTVNIQEHDMAHVCEVFRTFPQPARVSPVWSSIQNACVQSFGQLQEAVSYYGNEDPVVFLDTIVHGTPVSVAVVENVRGQRSYAASIVDASGAVARLSNEERERVLDTATRAHTAIAARHYSLVELVVSPRGVYVIDVKTAPVLHDGALVRHSLENVGMPFSSFLGHVISLVHD